MSATVTDVVEAVRHLTAAERREVLARLLPEQAAHDGQTFWMSIRYGDQARVVAYTPEQEEYLPSLRELRQSGALARLESRADGTYEVYGPARTYYAVLTPAREVAALLSSWSPDDSPREVSLPDET